MLKNSFIVVIFTLNISSSTLMPPTSVSADLYDGIILDGMLHNVVLDTKQEVVAGSTRLKAATAQKICLNIILISDSNIRFSV